MRKILLVMAVLGFVAPAFAGVAITVTYEGSNVARLSYTSDANVSAFALKVSVDNGAKIVGISDYNVGENTSSVKGYGIFPANFARYIDANDPNWSDTNYTPVADACDPGAAGTGLGTASIIIEMGALYADGNQPALSGTLCRLTVDKKCKMSVTAEPIRGKVVLEDTTSVDPDVSAATNVVLRTPCFPTDAAYSAQLADYDAYWAKGWDADCWCPTPYSPGYQCYGDYDGTVYGFKKYRVYTADYDAVCDNWGTAMGTYPAGPNPCADFDHQSYGFKKYRVYTADYDTLVDYWGKADASMGVDANCPVTDAERR